ncbi:MAG: PKD domain-containing protein, partial [Chloroflexi bacterium]|nr:PKD domain-containing protein [Chloroflexota bacterium]
MTLMIRRLLRNSVVGAYAAALGVGVVACGPSVPEAGLTAEPVDGAAPLTVQFTDTSRNEPTSWQWQFGDSGTSAEQTPQHRYEQAGTYTVTLVATNEAGSGTASTAQLITVGPGDVDRMEFADETVVLNIGGTHTFEIEAWDVFGNQITNPQVQWAASAGGDFDGSTFTAGTVAGTFESALGVSVTAGTVTLKETRTVTVLPDPLATVTIAPHSRSVAAGEEADLTVGAADQYGNEVTPTDVRWDVDSRAGQIGLDGRLTAVTTVGEYPTALRAVATLAGVTVSDQIDVSVVHGPLTSLVIDAPSEPVRVGRSGSFSVTA